MKILTRDKQNGPSDYIMDPDADSAWILVDNISIYIHRMDEGVGVELVPHHNQASGTIDSAYASFAEAEEDTEEE